jgi:hypothetical protein
MIVFIGDSDLELGEKAKAFDPGAVLLENKIKINLDATYYTSIGDCGIETFLQFLRIIR